MSVSQKSVLYFLVSFVLVFAFVVLFWYLLWKFVLEQNPAVRDFFDMDVKKKQVIKKSS
jgi:hypothetical protein